MVIKSLFLIVNFIAGITAAISFDLNQNPNNLLTSIIQYNKKYSSFKLRSPSSTLNESSTVMITSSSSNSSAITTVIGQLSNNKSINNRNNRQKNEKKIVFRDTEHFKHNKNHYDEIGEEGTLCHRSFDGKSGYCILSYQCLHIIREFRKHRTKIDVCSYQKNIPIICCPLKDKYLPAPQQSIQRISAQKCAEWESVLSTQHKYHGNAKKCESSIPLIVGGEITFPGQYPHIAAIGWTKPSGFINWACGGSLITHEFVLTAAHCTKFGGKAPDRIKLGNYNLYTTNIENIEPSEDFHISQIHIHPEYTTLTYYKDIALLKLTKSVQFTKFIKPICLWQDNQFDSMTFENDIEMVTAIGWGRTQFLGRKSNELLQVDLKIINNKLCNQLYHKESKLPNGITEQQFCAGYLEGGKDTCQGDSGGPIHIQIPKLNCIRYIIGITSFGKYCAAPNAPGVYTKISTYLDWIESIAFNHFS